MVLGYVLKTGFLACPTRMGGSSYPCIGRSKILNKMGLMHIPLICTLNFSQSLRGEKKKSQNLHPTFKINSKKLHKKQSSTITPNSWYELNMNSIRICKSCHYNLSMI